MPHGDHPISPTAIFRGLDRTRQSPRRGRGRGTNSAQAWMFTILGVIILWAAVPTSIATWWKHAVQIPLEKAQRSQAQQAEAGAAPTPGAPVRVQAERTPKAVTTSTKRPKATVTTSRKSAGKAKPTRATRNARPAVSARKATRSGAKGRVIFNVEPWAQVFIGNKKVGVTPIIPQKLPEGRYTIRLVNPKLNASKEVQINVRANSTTRVVENLG